MSAAISSFPPAAPSQPGTTARRPGLVACGLMPHRGSVLEVVLRWMLERGVSERDWCAVTGLSRSRVRDVLKAQAPFPVEWIDALADRDAAELHDRLRTSRQLRRRSA